MFTQNLEQAPSVEKREAYLQIRELTNLSPFQYAVSDYNPIDLNAPFSTPIAHPNSFNVRQSLSLFKGRANQLAWESALVRDTVLQTLFPSGSIDLIKQFVVTGSITALPGSPDKIANVSFRSDLSWTANPEYPRAWILDIDPLSLLKVSDASKYEKMLRRVENTVFGCSPRHLDENIPPEFKFK